MKPIVSGMGADSAGRSAWLALVTSNKEPLDWLDSTPGSHVDIARPRNYARDEGRPLGVDLRELASNHLVLHWSRALVVSVKEKPGQRILAGDVRGT